MFITGYCKRFYRIPLFPIFLLFHLFCIYWNWQGKKCKLEYANVYEINYIVTVISACTHPCGIYKRLYPQPRKNTFIATENSYLNEVLLKSKHFLFRHSNVSIFYLEISTLKPYFIFNETVCCVIVAFF